MGKQLFSRPPYCARRILNFRPSPQAMLLARARLLARTAPQRMLSMRRSGRNMCTAAAEKDPTELGLNIRNPEVQLVAAAILGLYAGATRWTIKDKQLAKQEAALKEAYEARHPEVCLRAS
eukprot:6207962-Pleurochrysis_carterae.AAC.2